ncbi:hypothetical protein A0H81_08514 [Grifola frondosa]|uniref:Uncharacterized protein n=1 Tax=Grifola frondosa TaxID=5627 RepID=A0A1C7M3L0_GRIFR|nr:hypothetical protein A0H81_08514 [Grifola frondosa]
MIVSITVSARLRVSQSRHIKRVVATCKGPPLSIRKLAGARWFLRATARRRRDKCSAIHKRKAAEKSKEEPTVKATKAFKPALSAFLFFRRESVKTERPDAIGARGLGKEATYRVDRKGPEPEQHKGK